MDLQKLTPNDFDDEGKLRPSLFFYFCFVYLCKPILLVVFSVFSISLDSGDIIAAVYPDRSLFFMHLLLSFLALPILAMVIWRKPLMEKESLKGLAIFMIKYATPVLLMLDASPVVYSKITFNINNSFTFTALLFCNAYLFFNFFFSEREKLFRTQLTSDA